MKTIREWFNDLPKDVREKALRNTDKSILDFTQLSLKYSLFVAFDFSQSPEGYVYWTKICKQL